MHRSCMSVCVFLLLLYKQHASLQLLILHVWHNHLQIVLIFTCILVFHIYGFNSSYVMYTPFYLCVCGGGSIRDLSVLISSILLVLQHLSELTDSNL
jgi:hypothetical protein